MNRVLLIFAIEILCFDCKGAINKTRDYNSSIYYQQEEIEYSDGTYCAEIDYYNSRTGTHSTYTLPVEIGDDKLVKIYWTNVGWLDESHFYAPDISDGTASFIDDREIEFEVEILNEGDCN